MKSIVKNLAQVLNWINKALGNVSIKHELSAHQSQPSVGVSG